MKRPGMFGFSSTFIFATVARPSYSVARASTVGASRRQGPHHSAQKSMRTTPFCTSWSKLLSVKVLTLSDAIYLCLPSYDVYLCQRAFIYFDVLKGDTDKWHPTRSRPSPIV